MNVRNLCFEESVGIPAGLGCDDGRWRLTERSDLAPLLRSFFVGNMFLLRVSEGVQTYKKTV